MMSTDDKSVQEPLGSHKQKDAEESVLESLVLGGEDDIVEKLDESSKKKRERKKRKKRKVPFVDSPEEGGKKPAWEDEDDTAGSVHLTKLKRHTDLKFGDDKKVSKEQYVNRLKSQFEKVNSTPNWAKLPSERSDESEDSDVDELLHKTGNYLAESVSLPKGVLQIKRCTDANKEASAKSKLKSVEFHPTAQVVLTAGTNQTLNLFQVDGKNNPKIQSVFIDNYPMLCAHFSASGEEVIMGSKHQNFYYYDMIAGKIVNVPKIKGIENSIMMDFEVSPDGQFLAFRGKYGTIHLLSAKSKEWIHTLKMNGSVSSVAFSRDGNSLYSHGDDGEVYIWNMNTRDCVHRFTDDGCIQGTTVAISPNNRYLACGSYSGVVNIYETESIMSSRSPKPSKALMNLTTPCTDSKFNSTTEILAVGSNYVEKGVKLVHLPSLTVFSNFPDRTDNNFRMPMCMDFSVNSGYFTIGTHKGNALLYRLKHYGNY